MFKRNNMVKAKKKGQSTVEYILLVAAVLGALVIFLKPDGPFAKAYNSALQQGSDGMTNMANRLGGSHACDTTGTAGTGPGC